MKKRALFLFVLIPVILLSQNLNMPESVTYDHSQGRYLVTNVGSGDIIAIDSEGNFSEFSSDQPSIRGILLKDDFLYTAGDQGLTCYNLSGTQLWQTSLPNAVFPNDVVADDSGFIYISDNASGKIYKVEISTQNAEIFVSSGITGPNGLFFDEANDRLIAVCWMNNAHIKAIDLSTGDVTTIITTNYNNLDGITRDSAGNFYISSWGTNSVYKYNSDFSEVEVFSSGHNGPADIFYCEENNVLAVPNFDANSVEFLELPVSADEGSILDMNFQLQNYPNPFNSSTTISFQTNNRLSGLKEIEIYNFKGQRVRKLVSDQLSAGSHSVVWDGKDDSGKHVSSGIYLYKLKAGDFEQTKRMIFLK